MVDIAQSDQFAVFMRKIGYTVGLEDTLARLCELTELYVAEGDISAAAWMNLVKEKWGLKSLNIGDVFGALGFLLYRRKQIQVLAKLDCLAICYRFFDGDKEKFKKAVRHIFLLAIIESDGEIFLNCLAVDFDKNEIQRSLKQLIEFKRSKLFTIFKQPNIQVRLAQIITIETQPSNRGSASGRGSSLSALSRSEALSKRSEPLSSKPSVVAPKMSEDWFRKVPPRRKAWAVSLGLCDSKGEKSELGRCLLEELKNANFTDSAGNFVIWPFEHEVARLRLRTDWLTQEPISLWTLNVTIAKAYGLSVSRSAPSKLITLPIAERLKAFFEIYRTQNRSKSILRKELPLPIAMAAYTATQFATGENLVDLPSVIDFERRSDNRLIDMRTSRNNVGSLTFRV